MKKYLILKNDVTLSCCGDLIGREFFGKYDGYQYVTIYPGEKWLSKRGYGNDGILLLPCEVREIL